jgi:hypothetical protein
MIPSNTFDLDGDGCVSKEDYTISLRNDKATHSLKVFQ